MGCFVSCRISTDKRVARSLCYSRATCGQCFQFHSVLWQCSLVAMMVIQLWQLFLQVYLLTSMDRAMLPCAKSTVLHCTPTEITSSKCCERYLKHIAIQTVICWLLAHTYMVRPKLHLVDLLLVYYTSSFCNKYTKTAKQSFSSF